MLPSSPKVIITSTPISALSNTAFNFHCFPSEPLTSSSDESPSLSSYDAEAYVVVVILSPLPLKHSIEINELAIPVYCSFIDSSIGVLAISLT